MIENINIIVSFKLNIELCGIDEYVDCKKTFQKYDQSVIIILHNLLQCLCRLCTNKETLSKFRATKTKMIMKRGIPIEVFFCIFYSDIGCLDNSKLC